MARGLLFGDWARRASLLVTSGAVLVAVNACEKLIGIEDTPVADHGNAGTSSTGHAGASNAGESNAGSAQGGRLGRAGTGNAGASETGDAGRANGGNDAQAGDASGGASAGGTAAGAGGQTSSCDCSAPTPVCENGKCITRGPAQIMAGSKSGNSAFFIDSTEVTNEQYAAFLSAKGSDTSGQRAACAWNDSYEPASAVGDDKRPAVDVDFCDAAAFCDWAGERLCGAVGGGPLAISAANLSDPTQSQWYLACASTDKEEYPYGNDYKSGNCNEGGGTMANVGTFKSCIGHPDGVFDLVGNAAEWVDSCVDDPGGDHSADICELMGGSYYQDGDKCSTNFSQKRKDTSGFFGFRCCSK